MENERFYQNKKVQWIFLNALLLAKRKELCLITAEEEDVREGLTTFIGQN